MKERIIGMSSPRGLTKNRKYVYTINQERGQALLIRLVKMILHTIHVTHSTFLKKGFKNIGYIHAQHACPYV